MRCGLVWPHRGLVLFGWWKPHRGKRQSSADPTLVDRAIGTARSDGVHRAALVSCVFGRPALRGWAVVGGLGFPSSDGRFIVAVGLVCERRDEVWRWTPVDRSYRLPERIGAIGERCEVLWAPVLFVVCVSGERGSPPPEFPRTPRSDSQRWRMRSAMRHLFERRRRSLASGLGWDVSRCLALCLGSGAGAVCSLGLSSLG